jgi:response regulator RpfG family c-di-GMP phosphodiesterase
MKLLVVDDDPGLRALIRATFDEVDAEIREASSVFTARRAVGIDKPDVIVLDVLLGDGSGLDLCRELKRRHGTASIAVVLLSGSIELAAEQVSAAGADAFLTKPFSPLQLVEVVEHLAGATDPLPLLEPVADPADNEQLLLYARDLRRIVELERTQRHLLHEAYGATVGALAEALATKDTGTRAHSRRVQQYALRLLDEVEPALADDPGIAYGFVLHDVGKIGISDAILQKQGSLTHEERRVIEEHPLLGHEMLRGISFLRGEGLAVVRSHHERWDSGGYPDGLAGTDIPLGARIFSVADALDAMTSDRPYRRAGSWRDAAAEIARESGRQFDPRVVAAFRRCAPGLYELVRALAA